MRLNVRVKISKNPSVLGWDGEKLFVAVNAPPVDGAANKRLVEIISGWIGIPKRDIAVIGGHTSRQKILQISTEGSNVLAKIAKLPQLPLQQNMFGDQSNVH